MNVSNCPATFEIFTDSILPSKMAGMTHPDSKFSPFSLHIGNNAVLTGIKYFPTKLTDITRVGQSPPIRPLLIAIHGRACNAHHFDVAPDYTLAFVADAFDIPVVSINRPGYGGSTLFDIPESSTFHRELGRLYHDVIFPALWQEFGNPNKCTGMVILAHSMGCPGLIVGAALHGCHPNPAYPLSGIIMSGWGSRAIPADIREAKGIPPSHNLLPDQKLDWKRKIMFGDVHNLHTIEANLLEYLEIQDSETPEHEGDEIWLPGSDAKRWHISWTEFSHQIIVPIMFALAEHDLFWEGTPEHVKEYETYFSKSRRFDGSVVRGAPHAIEWWTGAKGWYARCGGFAFECVAWQEQNKAIGQDESKDSGT